MVQAADGKLVVRLLDGDDDVQLAGALVDHADIDVRVGNHAEDARGGALGVDHALADDGDEGQSVLHAHVVGLQPLLDLLQDLLTRGSQRLGRDEDGDGVDAGRAVLKGNAMLGENLQQLRHEANLAVHHGLFHVHAAEALVACDAGHDALVRVGRERGDDERAGVGRTVGVADVDGDVRPADGEDRILMQDGRAHVRKLTQLTIGNVVDHVRMLDDARVGGQNAGNIRPVFIQASTDGTGDNGAGHVRSAAREGVHRTVWHGPVEAGDHGVLHADKRVPDGGIRRLRVERAVGPEQDHLRRVDKAEAEIRGQ